LVLWPPNHKYRAFTLADCTVSAVDDCAGELNVNLSGAIVSIYSDEPEDVDGNGDGHTPEDIVILGTASFMVRAERQGAGNGRVYGVTMTVTDGSGNSTLTTCFVSVPHDQSGDPAIDDGLTAGYSAPEP